jgi:hypothetical protein
MRESITDHPILMRFERYEEKKNILLWSLFCSIFMLFLQVLEKTKIKVE